MEFLSRFAALIAVILIVVVVAGCGSEGKADVSGRVTLDGEPLAGGLIVFEPADRHGAPAGGTISDGNYLLNGAAGVPPGEKVVRITGVFKTGRRIEVGPPTPPGTMTDEVQEIPIPTIYNTNSSLKVNVSEGEANKHDFALKSKRST